MSNRSDGRTMVYLGKDSAAVLTGADDLSTWDDEELARGRRRDTNGDFTGRPPRVIPVACYTELKQRQVFDAESTLGKRVAVAAEYLADVAEGIEEPNSGRMRACEVLLDRVVGKPTERITAKVDMSIENAPWAVALRNSVRASVIQASSTEADDIVDAEPRPRPAPPTEEDLKLWRRNNGPIPPPTDAHGRFAAPTFEPDPIMDDDDEFIEEDDDDPVLW